MTASNKAKLEADELNRIDDLVREFEARSERIALFRDQLVRALLGSKALSLHMHSLKSRIKEPTHLKRKLIGKVEECKRKGKEFRITPANLLRKVTDLVGVRVLHLYTRQIREIDQALRDVFTESRYDLLEGPFARTWDDESREYFKQCNIRTERSPSMYTSVHYVVGSASRTRVAAEIQVRTLMEEVWGEVNHKLNYPEESSVLACREQMKVLARVTSSATRLVDSIFASSEEAGRLEKTGKNRAGG